MSYFHRSRYLRETVRKRTGVTIDASTDDCLLSGSLALRNPELRKREGEVTFHDGISGKEYGAGVRKAEPDNAPPPRNMTL